MALKDWSNTAGNNETVGAINWKEGQLPSTVNNSAREMMAQLAFGLNSIRRASVSEDGSFSDLVLDLGALTQRSVKLNNETWDVTSNLTVPSNISLWLPRGASLNVSAGQTLTIEGTLITEVSSYNSGSGTVTITGNLVDLSDLSASTITATGSTTARSLADRFADVYYAEDWGVLADGSTDNSTSVQAVIDAAETAGGGKVIFPAGTILMAFINIKDNVALIGQGMNATILKLPAGLPSYTNVLLNEDSTLEVTKKYVAMRDLTVDGNESAYLSGNGAAMGASNSEFFHASNVTWQNAKAYGLSMQAFSGGNADGTQTEVYLENCHFLNNGTEGTWDGLDVKDCEQVTLIGCTSRGNTNKGYDFRGREVTLINCVASGNGTAGLVIAANQPTANTNSSVYVFGGEYHSNTGNGITLAAGASGAESCYVTIDTVCRNNTAHGLEVISSGTTGQFVVRGHYHDNTGDGIAVNAAHDAILLNGVVCENNGESGIYVNADNTVIVNAPILINNTLYGYEEAAGSDGNVLAGPGKISGNGTDSILLGTNRRTVVGPEIKDYSVGTGDIIASATTVTLPHGGQFFAITGTTKIVTITASHRGRVVMLLFNATITIEDNNTGSGNLLLAGNADKTFVSGDILTLMAVDSNWREVSRSEN
jgi:hypothetical protein